MSRPYLCVTSHFKYLYHSHSTFWPFLVLGLITIYLYHKDRDTSDTPPDDTSDTSDTTMTVSVPSFLRFPLRQYTRNFVQDGLVRVLRTGPIPRHVAFIMDGNRRFAKTNNLELREGHVAGTESLLKLLEVCFRMGINTVTIYAFSIENFNRPKIETDALFDLIRNNIIVLGNKDELAGRYGLAIKILGNRDLIPADILELIERVEETTKENKRGVLNICFPYTSRDDIAQAIQKVVTQVFSETRGPPPAKSFGPPSSRQPTSPGIHVTERMVEKAMYTGNSPPLDIMIRTSGVSRLSDFMLWQCHQDCTLEFVDTLWPDFGVRELYRLLLKWSYLKTMELRREDHTQADKVRKADKTQYVGNYDEALSADAPALTNIALVEKSVVHDLGATEAICID